MEKRSPKDTFHKILVMFFFLMLMSHWWVIPWKNSGSKKSPTKRNIQVTPWIFGRFHSILFKYILVVYSWEDIHECKHEPLAHQLWKDGKGHLLAAPKGNTHGVPNGIFPQLIHLMSDGGTSASKGSKMFVKLGVISQRFGVTRVTLPKTKSLLPKMVAFNRNLLFQGSIFRGELLVSWRVKQCRNVWKHHLGYVFS